MLDVKKLFSKVLGEVEDSRSRYPKQIEIKKAYSGDIKYAIPHHGDIALLFGVRVSTQRYILCGFHNWNGTIYPGILARTGTEMDVLYNTEGTITARYNRDSTYNGIFQFAIIYHAMS